MHEVPSFRILHDDTSCSVVCLRCSHEKPKDFYITEHYACLFQLDMPSNKSQMVM